jgi:pentatricopeptide repeat protein
MTACEKGGQPEKALQLFKRMEESGIRGNVYTFTSAISACEKCGRSGNPAHPTGGARRIPPHLTPPWRASELE